MHLNTGVVEFISEQVAKVQVAKVLEKHESLHISFGHIRNRNLQFFWMAR